MFYPPREQVIHPWNTKMMDLSGFWKLSVQERCGLVGYNPFNQSQSTLLNLLPQIENYTGCCMETPIGLVPGCLVNNKEYVVTIATEEASVIAANCKANKIIRACSSPSQQGFQAAVTKERNLTEGQIFISPSSCLSDDEGEEWSSDLIVQQSLECLNENKEKLIAVGNSFCQSMVNRGGGIIDIRQRTVPVEGKKAIIMHILVDVCEAMGANCVNGVAEGMTPMINDLLAGKMKAMYRIVTNYSAERTTIASFRISIAKWGMEYLQVAKRIVQLNEWAKNDPMRCVTHNKGIFNGIDGLALATGQDTRAIEASGHLHAIAKATTTTRKQVALSWNRNQQPVPDLIQEACQLESQAISYQPLTDYWIEQDEFLCGQISVVLPIGIKGGSLHSNQKAVYNLQFMQIESTQELAMLMASIGLAQNFAALLAIATEGIQKGHMNLHKNNILAEKKRQ